MKCRAHGRWSGRRPKRMRQEWGHGTGCTLGGAALGVLRRLVVRQQPTRVTTVTQIQATVCVCVCVCGGRVGGWVAGSGWGIQDSQAPKTHHCYFTEFTSRQPHWVNSGTNHTVTVTPHLVEVPVTKTQAKGWLRVLHHRRLH